jgi:anti-sigma regulatory factor (Ser/Thr protein kinase)
VRTVKYVRRVANRISELRPLSEWAVEVAKTLGCPPDRCFDVDLCLNEAISNVIRHGYADGEPHEIRVELARESEALVILIEDDARPFDPLGARVTLATSLDEAGPAGRGVVLLRSASDSAGYEHREGRNRLTLKFSIHC